MIKKIYKIIQKFFINSLSINDCGLSRNIKYKDIK